MIAFNFNNYLDNPIVKFCQDNLKKQLPKESFNILTLEDVLPIIEKLPHSKKALEDNRLSFVGDQLRLYLSLQEDNFLYVDGDVYIPNINKILEHKNCTDGHFDKDNKLVINNGTFFHSNKDCEFNKYYFDLYNEKAEELRYLNDMQVFNKYPLKLDLNSKMSADMKLLDLDNYHFYTSNFRSYSNEYKDNNIVYYTLNKDENIFKAQFRSHPTWILNGKLPFAGMGKVWNFNTDYKYIPQNVLIDLFKEQLQYTVGHSIKFEEV